MINSPSLLTLILAAGKGTRMKSARPKVLHKLGGLPLLGHVLKAADQLNAEQTIIVTSPHMPEVKAYIKSQSQSEILLNVIPQSTQAGTAHAVLCAEEALSTFEGFILILFGDTPLLCPNTLKEAVNHFAGMSDETAIMVMGMIPQNVKNYGRIIIDSQGFVQDIVEAKGASQSVLDLNLCNAGVMILRSQYALSLLKQIKPDALSHEYYLTDIVKVARAQNLKIGLYQAERPEDFEGINTCAELAWAENYLQNKWRAQAMINGVILVDPSSIYFSFDTKIAADVKIYPQVFLGPQVKIDKGVEILSFCHLEGVHIQEGAIIGPYARLRPGTVVGTQSKVGNFVELKKTVLKPHVKVSHLTYLGDTSVGENTNIGAGTITCNYDGYQKWPTTIGSHVFIGASTSLIAPIAVGEGAVIGAGSTISKDVTSHALAVERAPQREIAQGGSHYHQRHKSSSK